MESWRAAYSALHQASLKQDSLGGLPLIILTRESINEDEREQQKHLSQLSSRAQQTIAVHSGHFIQLERPDLVIDAISKVLSPKNVHLRSGTSGTVS